MFTLGAAQTFACNGAPGAQGPAGANGPIGPQGPSGTFSGTFTGDTSFTGNASITGDLTLSGRLFTALGESKDNAAASCSALLAARPSATSGVYWLHPASATAPFRAYCDMTTQGGGWTLVWSNLRGGRGKVTTDMQWNAAINTAPRFDGEPTGNLESFTVYTGLKHWSPLAPAGQLRYDWATDYAQPLSQSYACPFSLDPNANYRISFTTASCTHLVGTVVPGLVGFHNNAQFSTYDRDNDSTGGANCSTNTASNTPWWFTACWSGGINGGGENSSGFFNGAYWVSSLAAWATTTGVPPGGGAGNGWIFIR